ncbi:hypothetical protein CNMCM6936_003383 [Aspergillus lentulus]|uniref:Uncharacterized protein n=1 Tax=Aspergillus lentulus TaxID=293939 RepID=A0AAN5YYN7_ASPLE|nr:hypothetical protein CNMCM6069_003448 [Aspergillus lentulus]KAF4170195.1 hypothetical protein CNMCM6936_003383 [Aspergillus lentulus]KAF4183415.1 hypothetical protein CNMCM8060_003327 [Aspergillus lentulus]KAF4197564.1 hypothetical protein CNMCM8694_002466 [Aspergillus lentulus]KAF4209799.1 hypothetical protein CNMCM8927_005002 [Aspergillus lentulus]
MPFTKTYFLCPISDFISPPPKGPLSLGSIIRSTSAPQYPLNRASVVTVTDAFPPVVERDWRKTVSSETGLGLGVYAQFLQLATGGLPLGSEVNVEHSNKTANTFAFDTVTTLAFEPTQEYVEEAVKAPAVQTWLREPRQKFALVSELFIVTGMKLVKGAKIKYSTSQSTTTKGNFGIDVTALGTTFGPKGYWTRTNDDATESNSESEFVFAFRVKRLRFGRRLKLEEYNKGAFMTVGGENDDDGCVLVEDVDGATIRTAEAVPDVTENDNVYCIPA